MRGIYSLFVLCIVSVCNGAGQTLEAIISVGRVRASLKFEASGADVKCTLEDGHENFPQGLVTVTIHPVWMNYDVSDKCTNPQLGNPISGKSDTLEKGVKNQFTLKSTTLDELEGKSVVITASKRYCGTILKEGSYITAVAVFTETVRGSVFFRQFYGSSNDNQTLVVSEIMSTETFKRPAWKVVDGIKNCDDETSLASKTVFNPDSLDSPSVGDLSGKFGPPPINTGSGKTPFSDSDLPLQGSKSISDLHIVVFDKDQPSLAACAKIAVFRMRRATALFSRDGVHGHMTFNQASPLDLTHTNIMLEGLNSSAKGFHVHKYPVPVQTEKSQALCAASVVSAHFNPFAIAYFPDPTIGTDDEYEIGDLSSKYGVLAGLQKLSENYTDWNLPLFGKNSIVGRSLVIHKDDVKATRWVCSNIELDGEVVSAVAVFKYPIIGHVYFTQAADMPLSDTWIFVQLGYLDNTQTSSDHQWHINREKVGEDMTTKTMATRCSSTGVVYDPLNGDNCTQQDKSLKCKLGDLSGKHGTLNIGTSIYMAKAYFTDVFLPLSNDKSIVGKSVVVMNGSDILACATIENLHRPSMKVSFNSGRLSGTVSFKQQPGFGQRLTTVSVGLAGFDKKEHRLQIHALPPLNGDDQCSNLGGIYNPLEVTSEAGGVTRDQFKLGDLSRGDMSMKEWRDLNIPLSGRTSIRGRSLAVVDSASKVVACGIIREPYSRSFHGYQVTAKAVFSNPLSGYIELTQTLYNDGATGDTTVLVNLQDLNGSMSPDHNWHTHEKHVSGDANAATKRCSSAGPHYDPFMAMYAPGYSTECSMKDQLRCELGDQAKKLGTYSLGAGRKVFTDIDLPLNGLYKVQGRSFVVHTANKGAPRYACADINPVSSLAVEVEFKTPQLLDLAKAAEIYAYAIMANTNDIVLELVSTSKDITKVKVHFLGLQRNVDHAKFLAYFANADNRNNLGKYAPTYDPNKASDVAIPTVLLLMALLINIVFFKF